MAEDGVRMNSDEKRLWLFARAGSAVEGTAQALTLLGERLGLSSPHLSSSSAISASPWELIAVHGTEAADTFAPHLCDAACAVAEQLGAVVVALWVDPVNDAARVCRCSPPGADRHGTQSFSGRRKSVVEEASLYVGLEASAVWPLLGRDEEPYPGDLPPATEEERFIDEKLREARMWMRRYLEAKGSPGQGKGR